MYLRTAGLGQPAPMVPQSPPPGPGPAPMPNPGTAPPAPWTQGFQILLVGSQVECDAARLAEVRRTMPGISADDVRIAIQTAHDHVFADLTDEAAPPRAGLTGVRTPLTVARFQAAFGRSPDERLTPGGADLGTIVATRLAGARRTMFSSSVRISCWGWAWPGGGLDRPRDYLVRTMPGVERVALGDLFWRQVAAGDPVSPGCGMVIAGLVIRYGLSYQPLAPPFRNIHCYLKYGLTMLGHPVPSWVEAKCSAGTAT
ncbi:MAG: hypothetical protein JNJ80_08880 [Gemmatimonadetes bacterium]|nr:hypothetical protein [Gemmatimonadota bacterium]